MNAHEIFIDDEEYNQVKSWLDGGKVTRIMMIETGEVLYENNSFEQKRKNSRWQFSKRLTKANFG